MELQPLNINNMPELPYAIEEALNRLRINISFLSEDIRKIMVISTMPDEGKSFVGIQLWRQIAQAGIKTVLVDMDLRKSVMVDKYEMKAEPFPLRHPQQITGTSYYLSKDVPLDWSVYKTNIANGYIMPNVDNVVNPTTLIEGKKIRDMFKALEQEYRYVLVDAPPLNLVADGERIGSYCDGAILVVAGGVTSKKLIRNSVRQLERAGCPLLGVVLNRVEGASGGYYYKRYGAKKYYGNKYYGSHYYGNK